MARQLSKAEDIVAEVSRNGIASAEQQMEALISLFCDAARSIDPTITKMWVGRGGEGAGKPFMVGMERLEGASVRGAVQ